MTIPTHILAGLIIGSITGDYRTALAGSVLIDLDHTISFVRHGILWKPRQLIKALSDETDPWGDQRNFLHTVPSLVILSGALISLNFRVGMVFSVAYFFHLVFDALDNTGFYPFYPSRRFRIRRGLVPYYSKRELAFEACLLLVFSASFFMH